MYGVPTYIGTMHDLSPDYMLDEWSRQILTTRNVRRFSRESSGQRPGGAMRIVKPSSASNSPRPSNHAARRRTILGEGMATQSKIRQQLIEEAVLSAAMGDYQQSQPSNVMYSEPTERPARPVSWHPSTQLHQPAFQLQIHQVPLSHHEVFPTQPQFSPDSAYSCQTSPLAFSPLPMSYLPEYSPEQMPLTTSMPWDLAAQTSNALSPVISQANCSMDMFPQIPEPLNQAPSLQPDTGVEWSTFPAPVSDSASPPTPDSFPPVQQSEPTFPSEEAIPYQPLEEEDEEGEILIGMGLYDKPDKDFADTGLDNYRSTTCHLLGTAAGKPLKLLEAWHPPPSDDEEDEDEDQEEEADKEPSSNYE